MAALLSVKGDQDVTLSPLWEVRARGVFLGRLIELVIHVSVAGGRSPEEVDVHEALLSDRPERDRTSENVIFSRRTPRHTAPGPRVKLLGALPEDVVALAGAVLKI